MKKFLLLLVGVLFALSAKANWTFYVDISGTDWTEAPYFYAGHDETFFEAKRCETEPVKNQIYKVTFNGWGDLTELYICKSKLVNTACTKAQIEEAGTANVDWFGKFSTTAYSQPEYGFDSDNTKTPLFKLTEGANGASITVNYDPNATDPGESTVVYKYSGDETGWNGNSGAKELALTDNHDGTYSLTRTFANNKNFGIREYTNGKQTAWYYGVKGGNTISTVGQTYNAVTSDGSNWSFQLTAGEYTLTFNPTEKTIVFTSTATPAVKTAYTIYFDAVRSGSAWANPHLTLGGVEVIGVADGSLIKYAFNAAEGDAIAFSNGSRTFDPVALENNTVYYVKNDEITSASKTGYSYSPTHEFTYDVWGEIDGNGWGSTPMTYFPDGTWRTAAIKFVAGGFGIRKLKDGNQYKGPDNNNDEYGWISCSSTSNNNMSLGVKSVGVIKAGNSVQDWEIASGSELDNTNQDNKKDYVLVFDPNPENMTIMFINPAAVEASVAAEATTIDGANANNLNVDITVADYYKGTGATEYTLSNGSYSATSNDGNFTNVPYATNYTLKPDNGSAMPINIKLPTTTFDISARYPILVAPAPGSASGTNASLVVYFKATCGWWYNLPQIVCTCGGETISGTVVWNSPEVGTEYEYDFAFIANGVVAYDSVDMKATEDKTFNFVITPVYPFAVEAPAATPAPSMMRAAAANSFQYVYGAAIDNVEPVEITQHGSTVSGVEGVMIEDEEAPVEYFNLQGQRVNGDLAPGIYIRRQGSSVTKVRF